MRIKHQTPLSVYTALLVGSPQLQVSPWQSLSRLWTWLRPWIPSKTAVADTTMQGWTSFMLRSPPALARVTLHTWTPPYIFTYLCNTNTTLLSCRIALTLISDDLNWKGELTQKALDNNSVLSPQGDRLSPEETEGREIQKSGCGWCVLGRISHKHGLYEPTCATWLRGQVVVPDRLLFSTSCSTSLMLCTAAWSSVPVIPIGFVIV